MSAFDGHGGFGSDRWFAHFLQVKEILMVRCPSINPKSTRPDRCQRPRGHSGDHVGVSHSGTIIIYPSKWTDEEVQGL